MRQGLARAGVRWTLSCCATVLLQSVAQAATPLPSTVQPGAIERSQQPLAEPDAARRNAVQVPIQGDRAPAGAEQVRFELKSLHVTGAQSVLGSTLVQPHLARTGQRVSLADVYAIAADMTAQYRKAGYLLGTVVVPAQTITDGRVELQAIEGYVATVQFEGSLRRASGLLEDIRATLTSERPLRSATLEREMLLLNDLPGVTAQAILRASATTPGASDLLVRIQSTHVVVSASANNRGSRLQGPGQLQTAIELHSLFGLYDTTTLQYLQATQREELQYLSLSHRERLTQSGIEAALSASRSRAAPQLAGTASLLNIETHTDQVRLDFSYPMHRSRSLDATIRLGVSRHDGRTETLGAAQLHDRISALRLGFSFDGVDRWRGVNRLDLELSEGLTAFGASRFNDPQASRPGGRPSFTKLTLYLARLQSLGNRFSLLGALSAQQAQTNLLAPEEFAYGGEYFGRGYDASEIAGDSGAAAKLELRYTLESRRRNGLTLYVFGDHGRIWRRLGAGEIAAPTEHASSAGLGARVTVGSWLSGYVEAASPLDHDVAAEGNRSTRLFGGVQLRYGF